MRRFRRRSSGCSGCNSRQIMDKFTQVKEDRKVRVSQFLLSVWTLSACLWLANDRFKLGATLQVVLPPVIFVLGLLILEFDEPASRLLRGRYYSTAIYALSLGVL